MYIGNKRTVVIHGYLSFFMVWRTASTSLFNIAEALGCTADKLIYENWPDRCNLWQPELAELLSGCTDSEQQFLLGVLIAIKDLVKANRHIFGSTISQ